jgi:hypothetical protein
MFEFFGFHLLAQVGIVTASVPDPWHFGVDPDLRIHASVRIRIRIQILDPDPAFFVIDLQDASKKLIF